MKVNIPWNRYALIAEMVDRLKDRRPQLGKTALQKLVYLLQEVCGLDCGYRYRFDFHIHGTFSSELLQELDLVESIGGVKIVPTPSSIEKYNILPGRNIEALRKKVHEFLSDERVVYSLNKLVEDFGGLCTRELELFSTVVYVVMELNSSGSPISQPDIIRIVKTVKPRFTDGEIQRAVERVTAPTTLVVGN